MAVTPFADSPRNGAWGDRPYAIADIQGPVSYTPVVNGTAPAAATGGQAITPATFGLVAGLEGVDMICGSTTGTYIADAFQTTSYQQGQGNSTWILRWYVAATGAEVTNGTNLSSETVRMRAFGPY
jgi:hypothetical protein